MIRCEQCDNKIISGWHFCAYCGYPLTDEMQEIAQRELIERQRHQQAAMDLKFTNEELRRKIAADPDDELIAGNPFGELSMEHTQVSDKPDIARIIRAALHKPASQPCRCFRGEVTLDRIDRQQLCRDNGGVCEDAVERVTAALAEARTEMPPDLLAALKDALSGWLYIRARHGDLDGVGWDRVQGSLRAAIAKAEQQ